MINNCRTSFGSWWWFVLRVKINDRFNSNILIMGICYQIGSVMIKLYSEDEDMQKAAFFEYFFGLNLRLKKNI